MAVLLLFVAAGAGVLHSPPVGKAASSANRLPADRVLAYDVQGPYGLFDRDIVVARSDGSGVRPLITGPTSDTQVAWSPRGTRIAFARQPPCTAGAHPCASVAHTIWIAEARGANARPITGPRGIYNHDVSPTWSRDGSRIAFCRMTGTTASVWVARTDRIAITRLSRGLCYNVA